jgi:hypothetical protein
MSQRTVSTVIEKTCDACGLVEKVEMVQERTREEIEHMTRWGTIIREVFDGREWHKCIVQVCSATCASLGMIKLLQIKPEPVEEQPEGDINLDTLRAPQEPIN